MAAEELQVMKVPVQEVVVVVEELMAHASFQTHFWQLA